MFPWIWFKKNKIQWGFNFVPSWNTDFVCVVIMVELLMLEAMFH